MRFYEAVTPLRSQLAQLGEQRSYLAEELDVHRNKMKLLMEVDERNITHHFQSFEMILCDI